MKVHYVSHNKKENGIVLRAATKYSVYVVYNCDGNWNNYMNYTARLTVLCDLELGWVDEKETLNR